MESQENYTFCLLCVLDYFVAPLFFKSWSLAVLKKGISVNPPPPVTLGQSCHLSADFGFRRHKFISFFFLLLPFQGCIKAFGWAWERDI